MLNGNEDLHGNAPDKSNVALLIIDMINDFSFEGGEILYHRSLPVANNILQLKNTALNNEVPVIYVNDNFGKWKSDFKILINHCIGQHSLGKGITELLHPSEEDYFVLKPKHSGFFSTTLEILLKYLKVETLILTGITTDICVLFTANDAYMRDFKLIVPNDCVAAIKEEKHNAALESIETILKAKVCRYKDIDWNALGKAPL